MLRQSESIKYVYLFVRGDGFLRIETAEGSDKKVETIYSEIGGVVKGIKLVTKPDQFAGGNATYTDMHVHIHDEFGKENEKDIMMCARFGRAFSDGFLLSIANIDDLPNTIISVSAYKKSGGGEKSPIFCHVKKKQGTDFVRADWLPGGAPETTQVPVGNKMIPDRTARDSFFEDKIKEINEILGNTSGGVDVKTDTTVDTDTELVTENDE